jgi:hypothetical protein
LFQGGPAFEQPGANFMKRLMAGVTLAAAMVAVSGCASGPFGGGTSSPMYAAGGQYHAYYDNFYGNIYDGYWSGDNFNFRTSPNAPFQLDSAGHFRKDSADGYKEIKGEMHPGAPAGSVTTPSQQ